MTVSRGDVWWGPAPHKSSPAYRPWLVISDDSHPFADTESIVLGLLTQRHADSVPVADRWNSGGSEKDAYVSPWYVTTIKQRDFDRKQGSLEPQLVSEAVSELHALTRD
jgi:mRNA-degrading endonuclease toxin of MazEF toxin-antitoxin module